MLEYIITHMFDQFRLNFSNRKGKKEGKRTFFSLKIHFWKIRKSCPIFTCDMSIERS